MEAWKHGAYCMEYLEFMVSQRQIMEVLHLFICN